MSSFRRRVKGAKSLAPQLPPGLVMPIKDIPMPRRPYGMRYILTSAEGQILTPQGLLAQVPHTQAIPQSVPTENDIIYSLLDDNDDDDDDDVKDMLDNETENNKKKRQWRRWSEEIIPSLIEPYVDLLWKTDGLRDMDKVKGVSQCQQCNGSRQLEITCVFFERKS